MSLNYYNYFTEIEDVFIRRRGKNLLLSPIDWALIETWRTSGIPLHIVIRAIEQVFDNFDKNPRPRAIKSLMFCREEVEAQYKEWLSTRIGSAETAEEIEAESVYSEADIKARLVELVKRLKACKVDYVQEEIKRAIIRIEELKAMANFNADLVDRSLSDIEEMISNALLKNSDPALLKKVERKADAALREFKSKMPPAAFERTRKIMILKDLRDTLKIPRLSLFEL
jgi:hypothetical protein